MKDSERNESNIDRRKFSVGNRRWRLARVRCLGLPQLRRARLGASRTAGFWWILREPEESNASTRRAVRCEEEASDRRADPVLDDLSLDQMLDTMCALGMEAVEVGTRQLSEQSALPLDELISDKAKAKGVDEKV